jgi:hypothetical protein
MILELKLWIAAIVVLQPAIVIRVVWRFFPFLNLGPTSMHYLDCSKIFFANFHFKYIVEESREGIFKEWTTIELYLINLEANDSNNCQSK